MSNRIGNIEEHFWANVDKSAGQGPQGECWTWKLSLAKNGYGQFKINRAYTSPHRYSYTLANGPIPEGLKVCHTCDVRHCMNPAHFFLGTQDANMKDMAQKGRSRNQNSGKSACKNGHAFTEANTYISSLGRRSCRTCNLEKVHAYNNRKKALSHA